jgi:hypothetical protein
MKRSAYGHVSTTAGASLTLAAGKFGGFFLNGSAGASTLIIKDGAVTVLTTSAGADAFIPVVLAEPIAFRTSILATCSGTGYYSVFIGT